MNWFRKYKTEIILFLLSFCAQLIPFFLWLFFHPDLLFEDKELYLSTAKNIVNYGSFSTFFHIAFESDAIRPPIYPLFLALLYLILFKSLALVLFVQNIIGALSTVLVYRLGKNIFNKRVGIVASIMYIFEAEHLMMSSLIRAEILFVFFFLLSIIYFLKYIKYFHTKHLIYFSLFLGIATLTRPNSQLFFVVYIFIFFLAAVSKKIAFKKFLLNSVLIILVFLAAISPWSIRNYIKLGTVQLSPIMGYNLYQNLVHETKGMVLRRQGMSNEELYKWGAKEWELIAEKLQVPRHKYPSFALQKYWMDEALAEIKKEPLLYIGTYFHCKTIYCLNDASAYFFEKLNKGYDGKPIINIPDFILFPLMYYGMKFVWAMMWLVVAAGLILESVYFLRKKKDIPWIMYIFLSVSIIYFAMLTFCLGPLTRYRFPTNPLIFILFAHFFYLIAGLIKKRLAAIKKS
ncbi:glycosyltransferase family 39 protein [Patescibacteria group bacterium]|nr:glycosyltransferase family 39 protein [Patescibacteria group bacterium]